MCTKAFSFSVVAWQVDDQRCWDYGRFFWDIYPEEIREFQASTRFQYISMELLSCVGFKSCGNSPEGIVSYTFTT